MKPFIFVWTFCWSWKTGEKAILIFSVTASVTSICLQISRKSLLCILYSHSQILVTFVFRILPLPPSLLGETLLLYQILDRTMSIPWNMIFLISLLRNDLPLSEFLLYYFILPSQLNTMSSMYISITITDTLFDQRYLDFFKWMILLLCLCLSFFCKSLTYFYTSGSQSVTVRIS